MGIIPQLFNVVYMLTNPLGERYIGSSGDLQDRMRHYRKGGHADIGKSIKKHGFENHIFTILAHDIPDDILLITEQDFIDDIRPELNNMCRRGGSEAWKEARAFFSRVARKNARCKTG